MPTQPPYIRRRLFSIKRLTVASALGVACTIAVAWGCVLFSPVGPAVDDQVAFDRESHTAYSNEPRPFPPGAPDDWDFPSTHAAGYIGFGLRHHDYWANQQRGAAFDQAYDTHTRAGWPMLALWSRSSGEFTYVGTRTATVQHLRVHPRMPDNAVPWGRRGLPVSLLPEEVLVSIPVDHGDFDIESRVFPLRPQPLSFIVNTLFYASLFISYAIARRKIIDMHRRRKGLCVLCKYDRSTLDHSAPCPECASPR